MSDQRPDLHSSKPAESMPIIIDDCWNRIGIWSGVKERCECLAELIHCRNCPVFSANAQRILDRPVDNAYLTESRQRLEQITAQRMQRGKLSLFTFRIADQWLGVQTERVEMVDTMSHFHSIPYARDEILLGLVNVRGELKVCVSLGRLFGIGKAEVHAGIARVVVVRDEHHCFAFPVSEISGTLNYSQRELREPANSLFGADEGMIRGILIQDNHQQIACLDESPLLATIAERIK